MGGLPSFPPAPPAAAATPARLADRGYALRHAADGDLPRLVELYADSRAEELAPIPWPPGLKESFLAQQFEFQHRQYLAQHPTADFLVIEHDGGVVGRYYLQRDASEHGIIDICLRSDHRGGGIGRALIEASQQEAAALGRGLVLQVLVTNLRALALYQRLGFEFTGGTDTHHGMRWRPS